MGVFSSNTFMQLCFGIKYTDGDGERIFLFYRLTIQLQMTNLLHSFVVLLEPDNKHFFVGIKSEILYSFLLFASTTIQTFTDSRRDKIGWTLHGKGEDFLLCIM